MARGRPDRPPAAARRWRFRLLRGGRRPLARTSRWRGARRRPMSLGDQHRRAHGQPIDDRRRTRAAIRGLRAEADRAERADRLAHGPARGRALPPEPAQAALPRPAARRLRPGRQHRGPRDRDRGRPRLGPQQPAREARDPERGLDRQGDRRPRPLPRLPAARRGLPRPAHPRRATRAARLARRARPGARRRAQLHGRQPRPLRRPRARPADQLPALPRAGAEMAGARPSSASSAPCAGGSRRGSGSSTPRPTSCSRSGRSTR